MQSEMFLKAIPILKTLMNHGHAAYFVGGSVRDYLLNRNIHDIDIATSATPQEVIALFDETIPVGIEHGTVIVRYHHENYEVTTFRKESNYKDFRHPSSLSFVKRLEEDLLRRDFTMNAMAMDEHFQIIDLYGGKEDLKQGLLRTVGDPDERFAEDPLRMMRAFRFMSQLDLKLDGSTCDAIKRSHHLLQHIAVERINQEFEKLLLGKAQQKAIVAMIASNIIEDLPGRVCIHVPFSKLTQLNFTNCQTKEEAWAVWIYGLSITDPICYMRFWKLPKKTITLVQQLLSYVEKDALTKVDVFTLGIEKSIAIINVQQAIDPSLNKEEKVKEIQMMYRALPIHHLKQLAMQAEEMLQLSSQRPGPWVRECLDAVVNAVLYEKVANEKDALKEWVIHWLQQCEKNY